MIEIELDVFSGRPNPRWTPTPTEEAEILGLLSSAPPARSRPTLPGLGFRGFLIHRSSNAGPVRVFHTSIIHQDSTPSGDDGQLHSALAVSAARAGFADLVA